MTAKKSATTLFILAYLFCVTAHSFPTPYSWLASIKAKIGIFINPIMTITGLWHSWNMFQDARTYNAYVTAAVQFPDKSRVIWNPPRMQDLSILEKYKKERYRKWALDNLLISRDQYFQKMTAAYIALLYANKPVQPEEIYITTCISPIPPPVDPLIDVASLIDEKNWRCDVKYKLNVSGFAAERNLKSLHLTGKGDRH